MTLKQEFHWSFSAPLIYETEKDREKVKQQKRSKSITMQSSQKASAMTKPVSDGLKLDDTSSKTSSEKSSTNEDDRSSPLRGPLVTPEIKSRKSSISPALSTTLSQDGADAQNYKPYSTSSRWDPSSSPSSKKSSCFLTLTPQSIQPTKMSLPVISFVPHKLKTSEVRDSQNKLDTRGESISPEQIILKDLKVSKGDKMRTLDTSDNDLGFSFLVNVPRLPKIVDSPRPKFTKAGITVPYDPKKVRHSKQSNRSKKSSEVVEKLWSNYGVSHDNGSIHDRIKNDLDKGNLYSPQQNAYYDRISREFTIVPPPSQCNRLLNEAIAIPNAEYVVETKYITDNLNETKSEKFEKEDAVIPSAYKSHLRKINNRMSYMRSMMAAEEKRKDMKDVTCVRGIKKRPIPSIDLSPNVDITVTDAPVNTPEDTTLDPDSLKSTSLQKTETQESKRILTKTESLEKLEYRLRIRPNPSERLEPITKLINNKPQNLQNNLTQSVKQRRSSETKYLFDNAAPVNRWTIFIIKIVIYR